MKKTNKKIMISCLISVVFGAPQFSHALSDFRGGSEKDGGQKSEAAMAAGRVKQIQEAHPNGNGFPLEVIELEASPAVNVDGAKTVTPLKGK